MMRTSVQKCLLFAALFASLNGRLGMAASSPAEEHSLSQQAVEIARPLGFPITNSMVVTWIVAAGVILFARFATRDMKRVPTGAQNFLEWMVAGLYGFLEGIIGPHLVKETFWFFGDHLHFHSLGQLVRLDSRRRHDRMGTPDLTRLSGSATIVSRSECRPESDSGHGSRLLRLLDFLGIERGRRERGRPRTLRT